MTNLKLCSMFVDIPAKYHASTSLLYTLNIPYIYLYSYCCSPLPSKWTCCCDKNDRRRWTDTLVLLKLLALWTWQSAAHFMSSQKCVSMCAIGVRSLIASSIALYEHVLWNYVKQYVDGLLRCPNLPTPGLMIDHGAIGMGFCGNSCYVGLLIRLPMVYVIVDHIVVKRWTVVELLWCERWHFQKMLLPLDNDSR